MKFLEWIKSWFQKEEPKPKKPKQYITHKTKLKKGVDFDRHLYEKTFTFDKPLTIVLHHPNAFDKNEFYATCNNVHTLKTLKVGDRILIILPAWTLVIQVLKIIPDDRLSVKVLNTSELSVSSVDWKSEITEQEFTYVAGNKLKGNRHDDYNNSYENGIDYTGGTDA